MATRGNYRNILVPFDNSNFSQKALEIATKISKKFDSSLYLVTIIDISSVAPPGSLLGSQKKTMTKSINEIRLAAKCEAEKKLSEKASICEKNGINVHYEVLDGIPSDVILQLIKKLDVELVVMGNRGLSGFSKIITLGSVSRKVSELATCPVLISH